MGNTYVVMAIVKALKKLIKVETSLVFAEWTSIGNIVKELTTLGYFEHDVFTLSLD